MLLAVPWSAGSGWYVEWIMWAYQWFMYQGLGDRGSRVSGITSCMVYLISLTSPNVTIYARYVLNIYIQSALVLWCLRVLWYCSDARWTSKSQSVRNVTVFSFFASVSSVSYSDAWKFTQHSLQAICTLGGQFYNCVGCGSSWFRDTVTGIKRMPLMFFYFSKFVSVYSFCMHAYQQNSNWIL